MRNLKYISSFEVLHAVTVQYPSSRGDTAQSVPCAVLPLLLLLLSLTNSNRLVCGGAVLSCDGLLGCQHVFSSPGTERLRNTPLCICVSVFGLFIGVFSSESNLVSNGSTISEQ
jgi:hypothetical protein